jgi:hypothetical protein
MISSRECFGISGDFSTWRRFRLVDANVLANTDYEVRLPLGNVYRGFLINTKTAQNIDLADCIDRVKLVSGTNVYFDLDYKTMQKETRSNGRPPIIARPVWEPNDSGASGDFLNISNSSNSSMAAWAYLDLIDDGYLTEAIDTIALSELKLVFQVNQTIGKFLVAPSQIIPIRKPSSAAAA